MRDPTQKDLALTTPTEEAPKQGFSFNDIKLTVLIDRSGPTPKPFFIPKEVGEAIGYAKPEELAKNIKKLWDDDLEDEADYVRFNHAGLNEKFYGGETPPLNFPNKGMTLLTEQGLYGVLMLARAPRARAFRKWLRSVVLPQIARSGRYSPRHEVDPNGALRLKEGEQRLEELRLQLKMAELNAAPVKAKALAALALAIPGMGENAVRSLQIRSVELLTGEDLAAFKPRTAAVHTPTSMAHALDVTSARIGRVITALGGLRGVEGMSEAILNTKSHGQGHVTSWIYTDAAYELIKEGVEDWKRVQP